MNDGWPDGCGLGVMVFLVLLLTALGILLIVH